MAMRGSKAEFARHALEVREECGFDLHEPVDVYLIADTYGIRVTALSELAKSGCSNEALDYFLKSGSGSFSAAAVPVGRAVMILENDAHAPTRRKTSVAHELAHILREHSFPFSICTDGKCRAVDGDLEEEADLFAGELLIPTKAAQRLAIFGWSDRQAAELHGVSERYAAMRLDRSGGRLIANRAKAKRGPR